MFNCLPNHVKQTERKRNEQGFPVPFGKCWHFPILKQSRTSGHNTHADKGTQGFQKIPS